MLVFRPRAKQTTAPRINGPFTIAPLIGQRDDCGEETGTKRVLVEEAEIGSRSRSTRSFTPWRRGLVVRSHRIQRKPTDRRKVQIGKKAVMVLKVLVQRGGTLNLQDSCTYIHHAPSPCSRGTKVAMPDTHGDRATGWVTGRSCLPAPNAPPRKCSSVSLRSRAVTESWQRRKQARRSSDKPVTGTVSLGTQFATLTQGDISHGCF